ncbi:MAG: hypothetical protein J0L89_08160 [Xanthomonadales bacterium]|nr:hypothetical protein [Xanthomonadales bacterium]MBN8492461.1 hypothetical protein [Burkholderiales bacterium]
MGNNNTLSAIHLSAIALLAAAFISTDAIARNDEPCEPTKIISSNYISRSASGVYGCTIRKQSNGTITAWMWRNDAAMFSRERYREKYAFRCGARLTKVLEYEDSFLGEGEWVRPQPGTIGDKWLDYICKNSKFY